MSVERRGYAAAYRERYLAALEQHGDEKAALRVAKVLPTTVEVWRRENAFFRRIEEMILEKHEYLDEQCGLTCPNCGTTGERAEEFCETLIKEPAAQPRFGCARCRALWCFSETRGEWRARQEGCSR